MIAGNSIKVLVSSFDVNQGNYNKTQSVVSADDGVIIAIAFLSLRGICWEPSYILLGKVVYFLSL